ncbi:shikimate dehydrogenase [Rhabdothermincola sp.]|uniref:shikimate dehydrogenase n=1 Tax=Rhabdothermincola sp. TaxID=2820405 RepID=UPI002FE06A49
MSVEGSPSGTTRVAAVIGDPVRHSLSPVIFNAAFRALALDWVFVAFEVARGDHRRALDGVRALGIDGLSVTMPHKTAVAGCVDRLSPEAAALGAVNCVTRDGAELVGHNTDGAGFVQALEAETGFEPAGRVCAVLGAGGAARAVVLALARAGAAKVLVVNRSAQRGQAAAALAGEAGVPAEQPALAGADLIVNATPVGMADQQGLPLDTGLLHPGQVVADLIYVPAETPLLREARSRGLVAVNGLGMLVHQAALQFEQFTGQPPPLEAMRAAARDRLAVA